ncbi:hypothetical protein AJ79_04552 [Helicocarpus griseus UAMH5409]|uniref:Uncharacterized protein n=1 Tax=Helicocarpus griseus UAMH5409 TaxID=1447875 RepID=A0A2B7XSN5_9EURO|nr:hypothetical protein AJ79_04552 [Helicocarpus griseus UAMH5409]
MLRCIPRVLRPSSSIGLARPTARSLHHVTGDFLNYDAEGILVSTKVPMFIGNPGATFVLITTDIGRALHAASHDEDKLTTSLSGKKTAAQLHFSMTRSILALLPRLHIPMNFPCQTDSNASLATLHLTGNMHDIVLDGTPDAKFFELANASGRELQGALDELKNG